MTSSPHNLPDYCEKYFEHKDLDRVRGKPTIDTIVRVLNQLKRNAQCVPTTLFGGNHGYLALIVTPTEYTDLTGVTNIINPTNPGLFRPTTRTTTPVRTRSTIDTTTENNNRPLDAAEIATQKATHNEQSHLYHEYRAMKTIFRNQIINAHDGKYLQALRDKTSMINKSIPDIINFLTARYGKVSAEEFEKRELEIKEYLYNPTEPIDSVYDKIEEFSDLCDLINHKLTEQRKVHLAYLIISRTKIFRDSLKEWNKEDEANKTLDKMKTFMREQYDELEAVSALSVEETMNHTDIIEELKLHQEHLSERFETQLKMNLVETLDAYSRGSIEEIQSDNYSKCGTCPTASESSGSISNVSHDSAVMIMMQKMMERMDNWEKTPNKSNRSNSNNSENSKENINPKSGKSWKRYCWSCGCCKHWGRNCPSRKAGHRIDATFKDRKGGSPKGVIGA